MYIRALETLSPLQTLKRGYTVVERKDSKNIVTSATELKKGEHIRIRFHDGNVSALIE
jgi:exodeoxyribonuclease VII large subunit